ncbi:MAG: hypothetical protein LBD58_06105 [Treponema sp.]|nr:hypothetical protein [Treponema sp.]
MKRIIYLSYLIVKASSAGNFSGGGATCGATCGAKCGCGGLNLSMGELVETLFAPHLGEKFDAYQYNLKRTFRRVPLYDDTSRLRGEIDIPLSNTTVCMAVEIKRRLDKTDQVDEHIKRMRLIRKHPPAEAKGKTLLGAIAAAAVNPDVREYAERFFCS